MCNDNLIDVAESTGAQKEFARIAIEVNIAFRQFVQQKLKQQKFDLTYEMLQVMGYLWENDGVNQQEIANATLKDKASLTYLIDNLTRRELVYRQEDTNDRRNKLIFLTDQGKQLKQEILPWIYEMYTAANSGITEQEFENAMQVLRKVINNLRGDQL
ncbi:MULTISPECIES: MarR family winged helix-turn-helix transcriptional regulator [Spirosoma]|uniref:MarR family transcriptional regulator n=1 Tax=Spirosoma liriopis TaxID=2937440 RepID=A0ABT0HS09_9BACT|nr:MULTISPECIES: MarR family transcriptional regulator [Spirosoma]MCK8494972.1 MarR family transcriptional regulator [Spirosoma liriopis]UHG94126.1 MarR family transcriptional regulator [Spirosoma oryzicola]